MMFRASLAIAAAPSAGTVSAQDPPEDWQLTVRRDIHSASVTYDNGISLVVRCQGGGLETYVGGLTPEPLGDDGRRTIDYAFGNAALRASTWQMNEDGAVIFAELPGPLARRFRAGGELQLRTQARDDQPPRRYVISVPPSASVIDQVLTACGKPTIEPRDALRTDESSSPPPSEQAPASTWARIPMPQYPDRAFRNGLSGMVVVSCFARSSLRFSMP